MRRSLMAVVVAAGGVFAAVAVLGDDETQRDPSPSSVGQQVEAGRAVGTAGETTYRVVCLPGRTVPLPPVSRNVRRMLAPDDESAQMDEQERRSQELYAETLTRFFADLSAQGWEYVTLMEGGNLVLMQRTR